MNNVITYKKERKSAGELAWLLIAIFCFSLFSPGVSLASGGGPTQPEVQGFTPIGVSDMVDPFTGDFTYNIPLMDVEGYPINIGYNSGVTMEQEASWVGLGWNLNVGSILRNMRGIPDDFSGDQITKTTHTKPQLDISASINLADFEVFGKEFEENLKPFTNPYVPANQIDSAYVSSFTNSMSFNAGMRIDYNNFTGWGTSVDFGSSLNLKDHNKTSSFGLNLTGSSENGSGFSPSVSLGRKLKKKNDEDAKKLTNSFGSGFNTRAGLAHISYSMTLNQIYDLPAYGWSKTLATASYNSGLRHYIPSSSPRYSSKNFSGSVATSLTLFGIDGQIKLGFTVNESNIDEQYQTMSSPAFGYFHLNEGQQNNAALLDFNRDNDVTFTKYTPFLASAFLTSDLFNVQAQGVGGSFRGYRNEVGYVFDPISTTNSVSGTFGYEFGLGPNIGDVSLDISGSLVNGYAGVWNSNSNEAASTIKYETSPTTVYENYALQEAGERSVDTDPLFGTTFTKNTAENFNMDGPAAFTHLQNEIHNSSIATNNRVQRIKRNQVMSFLTIAEVNAGLGISSTNPNMYSGAPGHHIGEITQLGTDGRRYVFGLPAYNTSQEEVTMAVGEDLGGNPGYFPTNHYNGLVSLESDVDFNKAASPDNKLGIDNYFSQEKIPAYAHAYLLTAVLSDDYIDSDAEKGPSENDMGSYVKVDYQKVEDVRWRTPMSLDNAYFNEGLKSDKKDDKASFVYGTKELYYVKKIETKNYVAVFFCEDRLDGTSAASRNGGLDPTAGKMMCLKKICLYTKKEYTDHASDLSGATALQEVHFVYDYSLCKGYPANATGGGKLTLKEIYFAYQGSYKMKRSSYRFEYDSQNANYNMKAIDRWGTYQPTGSGALDYENAANPLPQGDFPYTTQDKDQADANAKQWALTGIYLPSGGKMEIEYESDDYAYVQNLAASQMFPIVATGDVSGTMNMISHIDEPNIQPISTSTASGENRAIFFQLKDGYSTINDYAKYGDQIYFKCLVNMAKSSQGTNKWEYVSGYGFVDSITKVGDYGKIVFQPTKLLDNGDEKYSPITKAAIQFARMNLSRTINDVDINGPDNTDENGLLNLLGSMAGAFASFEELAVGPNKAIYDNEKCQEILTNRSFIRLVEPSKHKLGGGSRVKTIKMYDNWKRMSTDGVDSSSDFNYGQEFIYQLEDGTSSGVASYEPAIGGDENSMVRPKTFDNKVIFAPDNSMYIETPIMESQFPNPSVGYSRVEIRDLKPTGVTNAGTGKVIKEFYTAKDFPVIVKSTNLDHKMANSFLPFSPQYEFMTASQGFYLELNDMHGKPKSEAVYAENKTLPISSVQYEYQKSQEVINGVPSFKLNNKVTTVLPNGTTSSAEIGVKYEAVADFRETTTESVGVGPIQLNWNSMFAGPFFIAVPTIWTAIDLAEDRFRTATLNKVVNKFGIMSSVTANQDGSIVETKNLAYDSETGEVLATQTTNDFNDAVYSLNFPAHWKYDQLGMAYKNIGYTVLGYPINADGFMPIGSVLSANFVPGDEVIVTKQTGAQFNGWVTEVMSNGIRIVDKAGNPIVTADAKVKIIRSGRRNKQMLSMASITSNANPLSGLTSDIYSQVLNAGAVEMSQDWGTYCDCFDGRHFGFQTKNPYVKGTLGNWRPVRSYTYLTERTQSNTNNNTNIRHDGTFAGFTPYYFYYNGTWNTDPSNWTFISEVTQFSPNGTTLETKDALGRYSASLFSFKNTLTTGIAANAMLNQLAEGSFEDLVYANCMDRGIFAKPDFDDVSTSEAHTGRNSIYVTKLAPITFGEVDEECTAESSCNMGITAISANQYSVTGSPTDLQQITISGTGGATLSGSTVSVSFSSSAYFELVVDIINKTNGCKIRVKFFNTPGDLGELSMEVLSIGQN